MKKFFSVMVLAVAAIAMVSCSKGAKIAEDMNKAVEAKDVARLEAIGDSIKGVGDKAGDTEQGLAAICYAWEYKLVEAAIKNGVEIKGADKFADPATVKSFMEKFIAMYDQVKDKKDAKELFEASKKGGIDITAQVEEAKKDLQALAEAAQAAEAEQAETAEALDEAAAALDEAAAALEEVEE